ncbi:MAG: alcohol dehydrogenase catalytic domain-containing protein [Anaerolineae bacterium]|nr:alcohol dehydrogenase catalytic domain-containing protein [Anaerolineae bacterium]
MRALRFDRTLQLSNHEPEPALASGEALIRLRLAGICHTDLEITRGYMGFQGILGHEFVGELIHDAGHWRAGQRVVGEINIACGNCAYCGAGISSQCPNRVTMGIDRYPGAFADLIRLPLVNLHPVPDSVPDRSAVFTEPLAAAFQVLALHPIQPSDRVIVVGAGKLGLLIAQVLRLIGCDLAVVARQDRPIKLLQKWGIATLDARHSAEWSAEGRRSASVVVDCTGSAEGFALSLDLVRPRGAIILKSTYVGLPQADLTRVVVDEIKIVGSRCGPFPAALRAMAGGLVDLEPMIDQVYALDEALIAFEHAAQRGVLKILLKG